MSKRLPTHDRYKRPGKEKSRLALRLDNVGNHTRHGDRGAYGKGAWVDGV